MQNVQVNKKSVGRSRDGPALVRRHMGKPIMTFDTPSQMQVVRKQEKEPKLKDFLRQELARMDGQVARPQIICLMMARTIDSPVMRALSSFADDLATRGVRIRTLLASLEVSAPIEPSQQCWLATCETRWMRNQRLVDAHELLVLGDSAAWVGDCMRRDPQKRDAFEFYSSANAKVRERASTSFERIWALSEPVSRSHQWKPAPAPIPEDLAAADAPAAAAVAEAMTSPLPGATRH